MKSRNIILVICFILLCTSFGLYSGYRIGIHYSDKYENILDTEGQYILSTYDGEVRFAIGTSGTFNNLTAFLDGPVDIDVFFKSDLTLSYEVSEELLKDALSIYFIDEQGENPQGFSFIFSPSLIRIISQVRSFARGVPYPH